jgi:hypothetical protein
LGLPCGSADLEFGPDETFQNPNINLDDLFNRKLCNIVGRVIERNQSESPQLYATTQNIDEQLEQLHNDMPKNWWDIPAIIPNDNSLDSVQIFNRIMSEMCKSLSPITALLGPPSINLCYDTLLHPIQIPTTWFWAGYTRLRITSLNFSIVLTRILLTFLWLGYFVRPQYLVV